MIDKQVLRDQLNEQADAVIDMNGSELSESLLDTAMVLVEQAVSDKDTDFDEIYENMYPLINVITEFLRKSSSIAEADDQEKRIKEIIEKLNSSKTDAGSLEIDIAKIEDENKAIIKKISELKNKHGEAAARGRELEESCKKIEEEIKKYPPNVIAKLEEEKTNAIKKLGVISQNAKELEEQKNKNAALQQAIDSFPNEVKLLVEQYEQQERRLEKLRNSAVDCSDENLEKLRKQVEEAERKNNEYNAKHDELTTQLSNLNEDNIRIDYENEVFADDMIKVLSASVNKMYSLSDGRAEYLNSMKKTIDSVTAQVENCKKIHKQYSGWLKGDEVAVNAMIHQASGKDNNNSLKHRFTLSSQEEISKIIRNTSDMLADIDAQLKKIDTILAGNVEAIAADENLKKHNAENL